MPFGKKYGGRTKGTPNKVQKDVAERCRAMIESPEYVAYFQHRLMVGQLAPALEALSWHYAYGKPRERVEVTGADGGPIEVHDHLIALVK